MTLTDTTDPTDFKFVNTLLSNIVTRFFFSLPWNIVCGGFAGYTALAMTKKV
jgi:hypothetical protein